VLRAQIAATPGNTVEQAVATALMVVGSMVWGLILGTIVGDLSSLNPEMMSFRNTMSELNRMMVREELPRAMRVRLREYFQQTVHIRTSNKRLELLELMSPALRVEVAWEVNKRWLSRVWFLEGASLSFLVQLALVLKPVVFAPGEIAPRGPLYIVNRGLALYGGAVYVRGSYFGEDVILTSQHLLRTYCALAMNYLEVFVLARQNLEDVAAIFPAQQARIRRHAVRLACRRAFILEAESRLASRVLAEHRQQTTAILGDAPPQHGQRADVHASRGHLLRAFAKQDTKVGFVGAHVGDKAAEEACQLATACLDPVQGASAASACAAATIASFKERTSRSDASSSWSSFTNGGGSDHHQNRNRQMAAASGACSSTPFSRVLSSVLGDGGGASQNGGHASGFGAAGAPDAGLHAGLATLTSTVSELRTELRFMHETLGRGQATMRKELHGKADAAELLAVRQAVGRLGTDMRQLRDELREVKAWVVHDTIEKLRA
jgi:hypothetical protein